MGFVSKHKMGRSEPTQTSAWMLGLSLLAAVQTAGCASQPPVSEAPSSPPQAITDFRAIETPEAVVVMVKSDRPLTCTATQQDDPRGVLLRFPATVLNGLKSAYFPPSNPAVRAIRSSQAGDNGQEAQVLLELVQDFPYEVLSEAEGLKVTFHKPAAKAPVSLTPSPAALKPRAKPAKAPRVAAAASGRVIRDVRTEAQADGVIIRVTADVPVTEVRAFTINETPAKIVFDLIGLQSAYSGEQRIPVQSLWVSQIRHAEHPDKVRLVAETRKAHLNDFAVKTVPEGLVIAVGKSAAAARQMVAEAAAEPASRRQK
jgi:hypothetical protein